MPSENHEGALNTIDNEVVEEHTLDEGIHVAEEANEPVGVANLTVIGEPQHETATRLVEARAKQGERLSEKQSGTAIATGEILHHPAQKYTQTVVPGSLPTSDTERSAIPQTHTYSENISKKKPSTNKLAGTEKGLSEKLAGVEHISLFPNARRSHDFNSPNSSPSKMTLGMDKKSNDDHHDLALMRLQEQSPAYKILHDHQLLTTAYRLTDVEKIDAVEPNSSRAYNVGIRAAIAGLTLGIGGCVDSALTRNFTVEKGHLRKGDLGDGQFIFFKPGVHRVRNAFLAVGHQCNLAKEPVIVHGNRCIVTVPQGNIGLCFDRGQPVILPPGLHQWCSETMFFNKMIDLSQHVIDIGPYTLLTVDEGYAAVTQDNGEQKILDGGRTYMLTHRNWRFEKFLTCKIQTNDLRQIRATTADNIHLETSANVNWVIADVALAALVAAETMKASGEPIKGEDIAKLRQDVLQQAVASVSAFIGKVRYSDATAGVVAYDDGHHGMHKSAATQGMGGAGFLFDKQKLNSAVEHANQICSQYGVKIISINIISAFPADKVLMEALAAGAVAAAEAEQCELAAKGRAAAMHIDARAKADAQRITAQGQADAERIRAQGAKDAANMLETSKVAVDLARIDKTGLALKDKTTFFFNSDPQTLGSVLSNGGLVSTGGRRKEEMIG